MNEQLLRESNLIRGNVAGLKILGGGELKHGLTIEADKISASAREKIEKAGGTVTLREAGSARSARRPTSPTAATKPSRRESCRKLRRAKKPAAKKKAPAKATAKKKSSRKS